METSFQKIIAAIVGVMIMFIIPVYIAFEKADDVSYSLAVKLTQNFVDNVRNKGYISPEAYSDFVSGLYATNNTYDVEIEHVKKRYDPAIYIYEKTADNKKGQLLHTLDYEKYEEAYEKKEITIDVGIYNKTNSNINVEPASITLLSGNKIKDKNGVELDPEALYKDKIDQYKETGKIVIDSGEIYADVRYVQGEAFDEDVYIPATIDTFSGEIKIVSKQGVEDTYLPYDQYRDAYFNSADGIVLGPTYNKENILYVPASMRLKWANVSAEDAEKMYYERINEYNSEKASGDGRIVFSRGEIYADKAALAAKGKVFDNKLDIEANITLIDGLITIKPESVVEGYETDLQNYDEYIETYKSGEDIVIDGEIYNNSNSDIEDTKAGIWKKGTEINEVEAEKLYKSQLDNYKKHDRVVVSNGKVYSTSKNAIGYDSLTDEIKNIEVVGNITVKSPTGWEPSNLDFDEYIEEYRTTGEIEYIKGGTYSATRTKGKISTKDGFEFDFATNEDKMLDSSGKINIDAVYSYQDISFGNVKPVVTVKNISSSEIFTKELNTISSVKEIANTNKVVIDGITYEGNVAVAGKTYSLETTAEYEIQISLPEFVSLDNELPSSMFITDENEIKDIITEYIENGNVTKITTYNKSDLNFQRETLEIKENGVTKYTLYHDLNKEKYDEYLNNAVLNSAGNISEVTIDSVILTDADLDIEYSKIIIDGKETINITEENKYLIDQYYNNGRIVIDEPDVLEYNDINIRHAELVIYEKGTNSIIYSFSGNPDSKHEKYDEYVKEYRTKNQITIIPTRTYSPDDIDVSPSKIIIETLGEKDKKTLTIDDNNPRYSNYLEQFEKEGRIKMGEPEIYTTDDFLVQDPHIQLKRNGNVIIDIYEKNNEELYDAYKEQYLDEEKVTVRYKQDDIDIKRASIKINKLDTANHSTVIGTNTIEDNNENYTTYLNEYKATYMITFDGALQYKADEIKVTDPSITITDPDTGSVIVKYEADFSKLTDEERYNIYEMREEEYNTNHQIISKTTTYVDRNNCYMEMAHVVNEEVITDKQIVAKLFKDTGVTKVEFLRQCMLGNGDMYNSLVYMNENSYIMNEGDQINVTVKNKNRTIASIFYSMFTANVGDEEIAKIYVDYGGTIKNNGDTVLTQETGIVTSELGRLFKYSGQVEEVTLSPGKYKIECWGAAGGYPEGANLAKVGRGAYAKGEFDISKETTMYVYVGGQGSKYSEVNPANGGYNGGGTSYNGYGGGGATDVRLLKGEAQDQNSLLTRIIVAAGGGGNSKTEEGYGGSGGNLDSGEAGEESITPAGTYKYTLLISGGDTFSGKGLGANKDYIAIGYTEYLDTREATPIVKSIPETELGSFGIGGSVDFDGAGSGGAGYFGGSAAHDENAGGGGGISYVYVSQNSYKEGINYPLKAVVTDNFEEKILEGIIPYIDNGKWLGIENVSEVVTKKGTEEMPAGINFVGSDTMFGNKGNGYAIIKKCNDGGCED